MAWRGVILAVLFFGAATVVYTFPLALRPADLHPMVIMPHQPPHHAASDGAQERLIAFHRVVSRRVRVGFELYESLSV